MARHTAYHRAHLHETAPIRPRIMYKGPRGHKWSHWTCWQTTARTGRHVTARVPATVAHTRARPSPATADLASASIGEHAPLQFQVILERGSRDLGLRTRNGAKHAQHGRHGKVGPGRGFRVGFEHGGTSGHHGDPTAPTRSSSAACSGGGAPACAGRRSSTPEHLPSKGAAGCMMSVKKQLAERIGQLFLAPHPRQRCTEQCHLFRRDDSAHLSGQFLPSKGRAFLR